jgi:hypothetical protein
MKLTKTKLKQLIKEEIGRTMIEGDEAIATAATEAESEWWVGKMRTLIDDADLIYKQMPDEGKKQFIQNLGGSLERWKEDFPGDSGEEGKEGDWFGYSGFPVELEADY